MTPLCDEIQQELRDGATIVAVCKKHGLTFKDLMKVVNASKTAKRPKKLPKYVFKKGWLFGVRRKVDGEYHYYGEFRRLDEAIDAIEKLKASDWSLKPYEYLGDMYVYKVRRLWRVQKYAHNQNWNKHFEKYEEAIFVRDKLVESNWDLSQLPQILTLMESEDVGDYCAR